MRSCLLYHYCLTLLLGTSSRSLCSFIIVLGLFCYAMRSCLFSCYCSILLFCTSSRYLFHSMLLLVSKLYALRLHRFSLYCSPFHSLTSGSRFSLISSYIYKCLLPTPLALIIQAVKKEGSNFFSPHFYRPYPKSQYPSSNPARMHTQRAGCNMLFHPYSCFLLRYALLLSFSLLLDIAFLYFKP